MPWCAEVRQFVAGASALLLMGETSGCVSQDCAHILCPDFSHLWTFSMKRIGKFLLYLFAGLIILAAAGWWAIGPVWRTFLSNPPTNTDVLFWTQGQRDSGFALADQIPTIQTLKIKAGDKVRELEIGEPLNLAIDVGAYMGSQNSAAVIVIHKGKIRLEKYGLHQDVNSKWTSFSVAKSMTSTLVGAAIKDGYIKSISDKVSDYVDGLKGSAYDDVSIEQLLTMTSGVQWNEDYADPNSDVAMFRNVTPEPGETAIVAYLKKLPRAHQPGTVFNYSTGETNLVGILVEAATGISLADYLSQKVWQPFGMQQDASWVVSSTGEPISGCCVQAAPRDYARLGLFMLENGMTMEGQVVPENWVADATSKQVEFAGGTKGYGYQWWVEDDQAFMAKGIFGQGIFVDPSRELVIAVNSSWQDAQGRAANQYAERTAFFERVRQAIDAENN
jgi:CubicO group peptidase (beta-lactamase class C family)